MTVIRLGPTKHFSNEQPISKIAKDVNSLSAPQFREIQETFTGPNYDERERVGKQCTCWPCGERGRAKTNSRFNTGRVLSAKNDLNQWRTHRGRVWSVHPPRLTGRRGKPNSQHYAKNRTCEEF